MTSGAVNSSLLIWIPFVDCEQLWSKCEWLKQCLTKVLNCRYPIRSCSDSHLSLCEHHRKTKLIMALFWRSGTRFSPWSPTLVDYETEDKVVSQGQSAVAPPAGILIRLSAALWYIRHPLFLKLEHFSRGFLLRSSQFILCPILFLQSQDLKFIQQCTEGKRKKAE